MSRARWSLAARLTVWYAATAFLLVAGAALVQYRSLLTNLAEEDDRDLVEQLDAAVRSRSDEQLTHADDRQARMVVRRLDDACRPVRPTAASYPPPSCDSLDRGGPRLRSWRSPESQRWRIATARVPEPSGGWVEVLLDRSNDEGVVRAYREELIVVLGTALLAATALGYGIARRGLRPLSRLARRVGEIDARSLERRLRSSEGQDGQPAEIDALVTSFDEMLERLEHAFRALTEFSAELAHELRTPIHVLRQQAEVALQRARRTEEYRDVLGSSLEELHRMQRMVDDILFLARAEDPRAVNKRTRLRLTDEVTEVLDFLSADASEREVALTSSVPSALELSADRMLLRRALVNVLGNALRYTPTGGRVRVAASESAAMIAIEVCDTGEGIPPELLPYVFDRHVRGRSSSTRHPEGAGLGLAIVRGIMTLHGGSAAASSAALNGTCVTLAFPKQPIDGLAQTDLAERATADEPRTNLSQL